MRCLCANPHPGHGTVNITAQLDAMSLEETENENIAPTSTDPPTPGTTTTPPSSTSSRASDTPRKLSSSNSTSDTQQEKRKKQIGKEIHNMAEELCIHCFSRSFFSGFDDDATHELVDSLPLLAERRFKLTSPEGFPSRVTWPSVSKEDAYYGPLMDLLNEILEHFKGTPNPNNKDKDVKFVIYDKPMAPPTPNSLKPDLLLVEERFAHLSKLQWEHPIIPLEVKKDFWDALKQLGTYAREMFKARPGRQLCWALYVDHIKSTLQVILFTPDRVHYTQPINFASKAGYRNMAKIIAALYFNNSLLTIGEDPSRNNSTKLLPNGDRLKIQTIEFERKALVGRRTRILSVVVVDKDERGVGPPLPEHAKPYANLRRSSRTRNLSASGEALTSVQNTPSAMVLTSSSQEPSTGSVISSPN
jgi:Fungal protein kinase